MSKRKILIVDDEPDILRLASLRLKKLGYDVIMAVIRRNNPSDL